MYSQNDLDEAVAAGALSAEAAAALRNYIDSQRASPAVDEENFRLITGFNDVFVAIASAILLFAVGFIGQWIGQRTGLIVDYDGPSPLAPLAVAITSWGLELFSQPSAAWPCRRSCSCWPLSSPCWQPRLSHW